MDDAQIKAWWFDLVTQLSSTNRTQAILIEQLRKEIAELKTPPPA